MNGIVSSFKTELEKDGHRLLYLSLAGSRLYGTATVLSDTDIRGLFLPSTCSCFLGKAPKHIQRKNEEYDCSLWSLQYFGELVQKGDSNALDLLFSWTNAHARLYTNPSMWQLFLRWNRLYPQDHMKGFIGYAIEQCKRYGVKTERYKIFERICEYLDRVRAHVVYNKEKDRLEQYWDRIAEEGNDSSLCFRKDHFLSVCGALHQGSIFMEEFAKRMYTERDMYGLRTQKAAKEEGMDWKAISHAVRAIIQCDELTETGKITFPLGQASFIRDVKMGKVPWSFVESFLEEGLERHSIQKAKPHTTEKRGTKIMEEFVLGLYEE